MLKNIIYFALLNFVALAGIVVLSEMMVFLGTLVSAMLAATGLFFKIRKYGQLPKKSSLTLTAFLCSVASTAMCLSFEHLIYGQNGYTSLTLMLVTFFIIFIFVLLILKIVYEDASENKQQYPLTKSPIATALFKFWGAISTSKYSRLSDEQLIGLSVGLSLFMCVTTVIISVLLCGVVWLKLNGSLIDYPILAISALALVIVLMHVWSVNRTLVRQELETRFLRNKDLTKRSTRTS